MRAIVRAQEAGNGIHGDRTRGLPRTLGLLLLVGGMTVGLPAQAQQPGQADPPPPPAADTVQLVFEREVFAYPAFQRRNPFTPLTGDESGPRFEQLRLMAVLLSSTPGGSIALLGSGSGQGARSYRVRQGDVLGNMRILRIEERRITLEVDEFGIRETRQLELGRPDAGGGEQGPGTDGEGMNPPAAGAAGATAGPDSAGTGGATGVDPDSTGAIDMNGTGGLE